MPSEVNLTIEQGATFNQGFQLCGEGEKPLDLTGCTVAAQVRKRYQATEALIDFSTDGEIEIEATEGKITLKLSAEFTGALESGGVWDLLVTWSDSTKTRVLEGRVDLSLDVTR